MYNLICNKGLLFSKHLWPGLWKWTIVKTLLYAYSYIYSNCVQNCFWNVLTMVQIRSQLTVKTSQNNSFVYTQLLNMHNYSMRMQNCFLICFNSGFFTSQVTIILTEVVPFCKSDYRERNERIHHFAYRRLVSMIN